MKIHRTPHRATCYRKSLLLIGSIGCTFIGCSEDPVCTAQPRPAIAVDIRDATTGLPIAVGSTVVAADGAFRDSVFVTSPPAPANSALVSVADERAGTYTVTVTRPGYEIWTAESVYVESDA